METNRLSSFLKRICLRTLFQPFPILFFRSLYQQCPPAAARFLLDFRHRLQEHTLLLLPYSAETLLILIGHFQKNIHKHTAWLFTSRHIFPACLIGKRQLFYPYLQVLSHLSLLSGASESNSTLSNMPLLCPNSPCLFYSVTSTLPSSSLPTMQ